MPETPKEIPIAACDAINMSLSKNAKGITVKFMINPLDVTDELTRLPIGEVIKIYITKVDMGA